MNLQELSEIKSALETEWDVGGFFGVLRDGVFDAPSFERVKQILGRIQLSNETSLDRRLVSLIWFIPS